MKLPERLLVACSALLILADGRHNFSRISANDFTSAVSGQRCAGPAVVLFQSGDPLADDAEEASFGVLNDAAGKFQGIACFHVLSCREWPSLCGDQNIRRTPVVIVYPKGPEAAQMHFGAVSESVLQESIARAWSSSGAVTEVKNSQLRDFLSASRSRRLRLLFHTDQRVPLLLFSLAGQEDLWPHVHFGLVRESPRCRKGRDPTIVLESGQEVDNTNSLLYSGSLTLNDLREWILSHIWQHTADPGEDAIFAAIEFSDLSHRFAGDRNVGGLSTLSGDRLRHEEGLRRGNKFKEARMREVYRMYSISTFGTDGCGPDLEIKTLPECQDAIFALGYPAMPIWYNAYPFVPRFCSLRMEHSDDGNELLHFNTAPEGRGREDLAPICWADPVLRPNKTDVKELVDSIKHQGPVTSHSEPHWPSTIIPELTRHTYKDLFTAESLCLIYLREGDLDASDAIMLKSVQERFQAQVQEQKLQLRSMWVDVALEKRLKAAFSPLTRLPSAVVFKPSQRRLARMQHKPEAQRFSTSLNDFLDSVIRGEAEFAFLEKKLQYRKDRRQILEDTDVSD